MGVSQDTSESVSVSVSPSLSLSEAEAEAEAEVDADIPASRERPGLSAPAVVRDPFVSSLAERWSAWSMSSWLSLAPLLLGAVGVVPGVEVPPAALLLLLRNFNVAVKFTGVNCPGVLLWCCSGVVYCCVFAMQFVITSVCYICVCEALRGGDTTPLGYPKNPGRRKSDVGKG